VKYQGSLAGTIKATEDVVSANNGGAKAVLEDVVENINALYSGIETLKKAHVNAAGASSLPKQAEAYRDQVAPAMLKVREAADTLEGLVADELWPLPKYREMLFQY
jgi:glutamine synthetase